MKTVFGYYTGIECNTSTSLQQSHGLQCKALFIRWIHKDKIKGSTCLFQETQAAKNISFEDVTFAHQLTRRDIFGQGFDRLPAVVYKRCGYRAAAECLNAETSSPCKQVEHNGPLYTIRQDVEDGFPDEVRSGSDTYPPQRCQFLAP